MRSVFLSLLLVAAAFPSERWEEIRLAIPNLFVSGQGKSELQLVIQRRDGKWWPYVVGSARGFNRGDHYGFITKVEDDVLELVLAIERDPWSVTDGEEGLVRLRIELRHRGEICGGRYNGSGTFGSVVGIAQGTWRAAPALGAGHAGHPRLVVSEADRQGLAAKMADGWRKDLATLVKTSSPSDAAAWQAFNGWVSGDAQARAAAIQSVKSLSPEWYATSIAHGPAHSALPSCLAYDLAFDQADAELKSWFATQLPIILPYYDVGAWSSLYNNNDASNWSAMYRSGMGMCALLALDLPWTAPPAPIAPAIRDFAVASSTTLPVATVDAAGVVTGLALAGSYPPDQVPAGIPTSATAIPETAVLSAETAAKWKMPELAGVANLAKAAPGTFHQTCVLAAAIDHPGGLCRVDIRRDPRRPRLIGMRAGIDGVSLADGDVVRLAAGRHVVSVSGTRMPCGNWEGVPFGLRLVPLDQAAAEVELAKATVRFQRALAMHEGAIAAVAQAPDSNPVAERWLAVARQRVEAWSTQAIGAGGWPSEGQAYSQHSLRLVYPFARAYQHCRGLPMIWSGHLGAFLSRSAFTAVVDASHASAPAFGPGGGPTGLDSFARGFPFVSAEDRPQVALTFQQCLTLAKAGKFKDPHAIIDGIDGLSGLLLAVDGPGDVAPKPSIQRMQVDPQMKAVSFRDRFQDGDDAVFSAWLGVRAPSWSAEDNGDLRLTALGYDWLVRGSGWGNGSSGRKQPNGRLHQNLVQIPGWSADLKRQAELVAPEATALGGRFGMRIGMKPAQTSASSDDNGGSASASATTSQANGEWRRDVAVAFASGSTVTVAIADLVVGTPKETHWQLALDGSLKVAADGSTCTATASDGATLKISLLRPAGATFTTYQHTNTHEINYHGDHAQKKFTTTIVDAAGGDSYLAVLTVQRGPAPSVAADGENAWTVGNARLNFGPNGIRLESR
ncbi:hypothetical protein LBMAG53_17760 [Planctomycetota bacterium]|nr:hypothetical protein LBMAG53_17760 [Planctomycetota bacterium]